MDGDRFVAVAGTSYRNATVAGLSLVCAGVLSILGIVTAEALYPGYSTSTQTISALGASTAAAGPVQPSATIFNGSMILSGLLVLVAAVALQGVYRRRSLTAIVAVSGLGVTGVGVFPAQHLVPHSIAAFLTFFGGGLAALVTATVVRGGFRYVSAVLGVVALLALVLFVTLGGSTALGIGGLERWITYPTQIWITAFGGYLLGGASTTSSTRS